MNKEEYEQGKKMFLEGKTLREISEKLNINRKTLSKKLREEGYDTSRHIPENVMNEAIDLYNKGHNLMNITRELNLDKNTLSKQLEKRGIRQKKKRGRLYTEYDDQILEMYKNKESIYNISVKLNMSTNAVTNCLIEYDALESDRTTRTRKCDTSIFKKIDTEEKAYWLGFLYADGYVNNKGVELTLKEDDLEHIKKFKAFMKSDHKISYKEKAKAYRICITSKEIAQDLINLGCTQCKSLILTFPTEEQIPKHLVHHFMRGYFDGDGCVIESQNQLLFSVVGNTLFLNEYEKYILRILNRNNPNKRGKDGKAYDIRYGGNKQCKKIYDFLYKNATIYLERKYKKFYNKFNNAVLRQDRKKSQDD